MQLSDTSKDFERIEELSHVENVKNALDSKVPEYFKLITSAQTSSNNNLLAIRAAWTTLINKEIEKFDKESRAYKDFFSDENMEEFEEIDDPKAFKSDLKRDCPIIRKTLNSKMEELQDWKEDFAKAKPQELFETFA